MRREKGVQVFVWLLGGYLIGAGLALTPPWADAGNGEAENVTVRTPEAIVAKRRLPSKRTPAPKQPVDIDCQIGA